MLHQDQLLVERDAVSKINKVDHAIPQNTVIAEVTNQVTGEESTRTLHWDQQLTTDEPLEVAIGETGKITVELALQRDEEAGRSTPTRSPISQLESITRARTYTWARDCLRTTSTGASRA
jgi:hypothetical protein